MLNPAETPSWTEDDRLAALASYGILDTPAEAAFDDLVALAAELCGASAAALNFITRDRQWCKAAYKLPRGSLPLDRSPCAQAIRKRGEPLVAVPYRDPSGRLRSHYSAAILRTPCGLPLGTLCVFTNEPLQANQSRQLQRLARQVTALLELRCDPLGRLATGDACRRASQALREAEQRVSLANAIAEIGVWEFTGASRTVHCDAQMLGLAGLDASQANLSLEALLTRVHADDRRALRQALDQALQGDDSGELELEYRIYDPHSTQFRWLTNRARRLVSDDGSARLLGTAREVTAERNAAEKLQRMYALLEEQMAERRQAEQRQAALIELSDLLRRQPDSMAIADAALGVLGNTLGLSHISLASVSTDGRSGVLIRSWGDARLGDRGARLDLAEHGKLIEQLQANRLLAIGDADQHAATATRAARLRQLGLRALVYIPLMEHQQLRAIAILAQNEPRAWTEDELSFARDVADRAWTTDERMRAERALRASEAQFRMLADNMSQFAWMAQPDGHIYWYNKRWYDYTGTSLETMQTLGWGAVNHPDHHQRVCDSLHQAFVAGTVWEETLPLRDKHGGFRWFLSQAVPIRDELGIVIHWFGTNTDITAQVAAEEALRELNDNLERRVGERTRELAEANQRLQVEMSERERAEEALRHAQKMEAIGQLTGGIAHDFNNMLTGVLGALDLIDRRLASGRFADLKRYLTAAQTSANRAAALTHRLLAFARRQSLDPRPVDVNRLVLSMEEMLRRTMSEQIQLDIQLDDAPWLAFSDTHQLENALLNLAINARDAMLGGGRLSIRTGRMHISDAEPDGPAPGDYVTLSVTDTGIGMPPKVLAKAFDPFFTTKPIGLGTGLGLSMVYGFIKQTGGHVQIDSTVGSGTEITLLLPRNQLEADASTQQAQAEVARAPAARPGETVLVVEDETAVRMLIVEVLEELGYRVLPAADDMSALTYLHSAQRIDLLVSDFGLPGLNGRQLAEVARELRPDLRVLIVTGYAPQAQVRGEFLAPGMDMLAKPFNIDELGIKVRQLIEHAR